LLLCAKDLFVTAVAAIAYNADAGSSRSGLAFSAERREPLADPAKSMNCAGRFLLCRSCRPATSE
jgi:hypothetical protein